MTATGGGLLRKQMVDLGMGAIPFGGGDGISDGSAATKSSFLNVAGPQGDVNSYMTVAAIHDIPNAGKFTADYKAAYGQSSRARTAPPATPALRSSCRRWPRSATTARPSATT